MKKILSLLNAAVVLSMFTVLLVVPASAAGGVDVIITVGDTAQTVNVIPNAVSDAAIESAEDGKGFRFIYGAQQYDRSFAHFNLELPNGLTMTDVENVSFSIMTNLTNYDKKLALVAANADLGLPDFIDYSYNAGTVTTPDVYSLSGGNRYDPTNGVTQEFTFEILEEEAARLSGSSFDFSIYLHCESYNSTTEYVISNITFNLNPDALLNDGDEDDEGGEDSGGEGAASGNTGGSDGGNAGLSGSDSTGAPDYTMFFVIIGGALVLITFIVASVTKRKA